MSLKLLLEENTQRLSSNRYPGRGIIVGLSEDGDRFFQIYWIMGRSVSSRSRAFEREGDFVRVKSIDKADNANSSLLFYYPVKHFKNFHIVTNGTHTDRIECYLKEGKNFFDALLDDTYEPDPPHYTPRIAGLLDIENASVNLAILKKDSFSDGCIRILYNYSKVINGSGYCIHTYDGDANPLPSFSGDPYILPIMNTIEDNLSFYWNLLDNENKVSLLVKEIFPDGEINIGILNKYNVA